MYVCMRAWMYGYMMLVYLLITTNMIIDDMSIPIDMNHYEPICLPLPKKNVPLWALGRDPGHPVIPFIRSSIEISGN